MKIRLATPDDASAIAEIYAPIVRDTAISFETEPPDAAEMARRLSASLDRFPWLVAEMDGRVIGYAYASPHRDRSAYRWAADVTAYVTSEARGAGVGRALYQRPLQILKLQGYRTAFAGIALPNPASVALHEGNGFAPVGVYRHVGYKHGRWHDVGWWGLVLEADPSPPNEPIPLVALIDTPALKETLT
jgi:L-amino acid N-acyltransferase YncA